MMTMKYENGITILEAYKISSRLSLIKNYYTKSYK